LKKEELQRRNKLDRFSHSLPQSFHKKLNFYDFIDFLSIARMLTIEAFARVPTRLSQIVIVLETSARFFDGRVFVDKIRQFDSG